MMTTVTHSEVFKFAEKLPEFPKATYRETVRKHVILRLSLVLVTALGAFLIPQSLGLVVEFFRLMLLVSAIWAVMLFHDSWVLQHKMSREYADEIERIASRSLSGPAEWAEPFEFWTCENDIHSNYTSYLFNHDGFSLARSVRKFFEEGEPVPFAHVTRLYEEVAFFEFEDTDTWLSVTFTTLDAETFRVDLEGPLELPER